MYSHIKVLEKIYRKGIKNLEQSIEDLDKLLLDAQIEQINIEYKVSILLLLSNWNTQ